MELRDYLKILRKRWWIVALVAVIAVASAYVFSKTQPTVWRSTITISIEPARASDYGQNLAIKQIMRNYGRQITTESMAQKVVDQLQLDVPAKELLGQIAVNPDEADYVITIEAKDRNRDNPQRIAQKFAELFVQQRQIANLEINQSDRILTSIVDSATPPDIFSPKTSINVLAGGVLGAVLGVIILFVLEWIESDVVRSGEDVERFIGVPVIGSIPTISARESAPAAATGQRPAWGRRA